MRRGWMKLVLLVVDWCVSRARSEMNPARAGACAICGHARRIEGLGFAKGSRCRPTWVLQGSKHALKQADLGL